MGQAWARLQGLRGGVQSAGAGPRLGTWGGSEVPRGALAGRVGEALGVGAGRHLGDGVPADARASGRGALGLVLHHGVQQRCVVAFGTYHRVFGQDVPRAGATQEVLLCRDKKRQAPEAGGADGAATRLTSVPGCPRPFLQPDARQRLL